MRIVHTSDWHAGRNWKSVDRLGEVVAVLDHLARFVEHEGVDLVLVSGDLFDVGAPPPEAEREVFRFFRRLGAAGAHSVVIAGNHDSAPRLEAWGHLAELVNVHTVGRPRRATEGGLVEIATRGGERARVAAVPFAPAHRLVEALELAEDESLARTRYAAGLQQMVAHLTAGFGADSVNLLVAHTHVEHALLAGSERRVHLGDEWAVPPQSLPSTAHYVALGHIHRPQRVEAAPAPTFYAGSPLQLDFGEAGETKTFVFVEASAARPARITHVPYEGGVPLATVRLAFDDLVRDADTLRRAGHLRVVVRMETRDADLSRTVRALLPSAVSVDVDRPDAGPTLGPRRDQGPYGGSPRELFEQYYDARLKRAPDAALLDAFAALHAEASSEA